MARTMTRRIRGRRCATRASFSGFACFGPLDELDAEGVEHLLQQSLFLRREIALGLGFEHRQDVDDLLCLGEVGNLPRSALAGLFRRFAPSPPTIPNCKAFLFVHRLTVSSTIYHTRAQQSNSVQA